VNLAVVYLGKKIPSYVYENLNYLQSTFPHETIYFVSDNQEALHRALRAGVKTFKADQNSTMIQRLQENSNHPKNFRAGFWLHTTSRFFALMELSSCLQEPIIQVEADVFLFPTFPTLRFQSINKLAFPLESPTTGAASIFYIPTTHSIEIFVRFILESIAKNGGETDMTLLGKYWEKYPENVEILPSIPKQAITEFDQHASKAAFGGPQSFAGVFDPLTYGMYLLGEDPMNNYGRTIFGRKPQTHLISKIQLSFEQRAGKLYLMLNGEAVEIFCLHVHSKNLLMFNSRTYQREIEQGIRFAHSASSKFSLRAFFKLVGKWITKRALGEAYVK
jgi:hypothetical protein